MDYAELLLKIKQLTKDYHNQMLKKQYFEAYKTSILLAEETQSLEVYMQIFVNNVSE